MNVSKFVQSLLLPIGILVAIAASPSASAKDKYRIAWTIYAGSMPLGYAQDKGILKKWGDKYDIELEAVQLNDYIDAQNQFTAGSYDAVIAMSLDALTIPASAGVDTTVVLPLSTSVGSDGIIIRGKNKTLADLKGKKINLVELSGSHFLLARALDKAGLSERDVTIVNTSDADMGAIFKAASTEVVVTWKPQLSQILRQTPDTHLLFDSSAISGEIVDVLIARTETLAKAPGLGEALAGAWYEVLGMLSPSHPTHAEIMAYMATSLASYEVMPMLSPSHLKHADRMSYMVAALATDEIDLKKQLETIDFFTPERAAMLVANPAYKATLDTMRTFAFAHGLLGQGDKTIDNVGIQMGRGDILGDPKNIKLRFPATWAKAASTQ